jgi:hypothetical protein
VLTEQSAQTEPSFTEPFYGALFYGASFTKPSFTEPSFTEPSSRDVADALFQAVQELSLASAAASTLASGGKREERAEPSEDRQSFGFRGLRAFAASFFAEPWPRSLFAWAFRGEIYAEPSRSLRFFAGG